MSEQLLETRIVKLEIVSDYHATEIAKLAEATSDLKETMHSIVKNLAQIKYLAMGAFLVIVAQTIGLDKALKVLLG